MGTSATCPSGMVSVPETALCPCSALHSRGLKAVMGCHIAPVSSDPEGTMWLRLRVSDLFRRAFQTRRHWKVGFRVGMIHKYKCLHLVFMLEGNNTINSIERNLFWLVKLELNEEVEALFLLNTEALVGEGNPENRLLAVFCLPWLLSWVNCLFDSLGDGRQMRKEDLVFCGSWLAVALGAFFFLSYKCLAQTALF